MRTDTTHLDPRAEATGPAVGTIVWGAVVIVVGALMLANRLGWFTVEPGYAAAGILLLAGLGLVVGGIAASRRRRTPTDDVAAASAAAVASTDVPGAATEKLPSPYSTPTRPRDAGGTPAGPRDAGPSTTD